MEEVHAIPKRAEELLKEGGLIEIVSNFHEIIYEPIHMDSMVMRKK